MSRCVHRLRRQLPVMITYLALVSCDSGTSSTGPNNGPPNQIVGVGLAIVPASLQVVAGQSTGAVLNVMRTNYTGVVTLTLGNLPAGITGTLAPATVPNGTLASLLTINTTAAVVPGTYNITIGVTGAGLTPGTATIPLAVTTAGSGYSLALDASTANVVQGGSTGVNVRVARTNFTGAVTLSVGGAPAGVTATVSPTSITGDSARLTITVGASTAPGTYSLTVTGQTQSLPNRTATFQLVVAPTGQSGLIWNFCASAVPIWLAYQNDTGPWTALAVTAGTSVTIPITNRGGIAYVRRVSTVPEVFQLVVNYALRDELQAMGADWCANFGGGKQVNGSILALGSNDQSYVGLGTSGVFVLPNQPAFSLTNVPDGARDLVASRVRSTTAGSNTTNVAERFLLRRAINPAHNSALSPLDFASSEAFDPVTRNVTIANLGSELAQVNLAYTTANRTTIILFGTAAPSAATTQTYPGFPAARQITGDLHMVMVTATASQSSLSNRQVAAFFRDATDRSVTLGPALSTPSVTTVASTPYMRVQAQLPLQTQYDKQASLLLNQTTRNASVSASAGYTGTAATWQLAVPDLSSAGFNPTWGLVSGQPGVWGVTAYGWTAGQPLVAPIDGLTLVAAMRAGVFF